MRLFLCEKASQGRDIARALGAADKGDGCFTNGAGSVAVTWARGHLYEQAASDDYDERYKQWRAEDLPIVPERWRLNPRRDARRYVSAIRKQLAKADEVVIATDAGREGELIAREVLEQLDWRGPVFRLWVSAFNDKSLRAALADLKPGKDYEPLYHAALARSRSDWLVGMNLSRAYTCQARRQGVDMLFSAGRVQSPTLALIVRRDAEIARFVPQPYYAVNILVEHRDGRFRAAWLPPEDIADANGRCLDRTRAETIVSRVTGATGTIESAATRRKREAPPLLLSQPRVQRLASRLYALPLERTDAILQELYDRDKLITYPRTESRYLAVSQEEDIPDISAALRANLGWGKLLDQADLALRSRVWNDAKLTDHHAIIPTPGRADLASLDEEKRKLYTLIARYYLAQFFPHYEYDQTTIFAVFGQDGRGRDRSGQDRSGRDRFKTTGRVSVIEGWRTVIQPPKDRAGAAAGGDAAGKEQALPKVAANDPVRAAEAKVENRQTRPPAHYTDDTLIEAMTSIAKFVTDPKLKKVLRETSGIGTSATRSDIIKTLRKRAYIKRVKKRFLVSTPEGR
ncbi:MAG: DNA topoisomerase 3, partial [Pseudomonadota bacterium]|nr:DNA topoisomerase 3 [Pseudomonadota bacterium]